MKTASSRPSPPTDNPFSLDNEDAYLAWRKLKLEGYPIRVENLVVEVKDPRALTITEHALLLARCRKTNMAIYVSRSGGKADKSIPKNLGQLFGLERLDHNWLADDDSITSVSVAGAGPRSRFIPFTNRAIHWHTDGYYNPSYRQIHSLILHCVNDADAGGENALLDHEIAFILLRDANPEYIRALMAPDAMTIPARMDEHGIARPDETGPVFSFHPVSGELHMRYTARTRSIRWKQDRFVQAAADLLGCILESDTRHIFRIKLKPGMGIVCNNVLHNRTGFIDGAHPRLLYRARFYDRIAGTGWRYTCP